MKLNARFEDNSQRFDVRYEENAQSMNAAFEGTQTIHGKDGKSAYEIAVSNGFVGTETEWLNSLHGEAGKDYVLTEADKTEIAEQAAEIVNVSDNRTIVEGVTVGPQELITGVGSEDIQPGNKYAVIADGALYVTACRRVGEGADSFDYIGNIALAAPEFVGTELDTGEPFVGDVFGSGITLAFADGASHKISIYNLNELDKAFADNAGMGEAFVIRVTETGLDKTNAEIYEAFLQNRPMYGVASGEPNLVAHPVAITENEAYFVTQFGNMIMCVTYRDGEVSVEEFELGGGSGGEDGYSPVANVKQTSTGAVITITDKTGTTTATVTNGKDGQTPIKGVDYFDGKDGYTPVKGVDYFDGEKGDKGDEGDTGPQGPKGDKGDPGTNGKDGYTPIKGVDYFDGVDGKDGADGKDGSPGADGKTPVKGTDYFTEADKTEMVAAVIAQLPVYNGEVVTV